jgi:hypothetical protein
MTKYGLLSATVVLALSAPAFAQAQTFTIDPVPPSVAVEPLNPPSAQWVPGYWTWDAARQTSIWVAGHYDFGWPPAETPVSWVPGHYSSRRDGELIWIAGHWQ